MGKRFGRNQKRKLTEMLLRSQSAAMAAQEHAWDAQRKLIDLRKRAVIVDVEAIESHHDRQIELRTRIMAQGRESLNYGYMRDPRQSAMARDADDLHKAIANMVASELVNAVEHGKFTRR